MVVTANSTPNPILHALATNTRLTVCHERLAAIISTWPTWPKLHHHRIDYLSSKAIQYLYGKSYRGTDLDILQPLAMVWQCKGSTLSRWSGISNDSKKVKGTRDRSAVQTGRLLLRKSQLKPGSFRALQGQTLKRWKQKHEVDRTSQKL